MRTYLILLFFSVTMWSQTNYPKDYFRSPLDIPMQLSGNFGELRPGHFHAGFDLKTQQREGLNVYAVADGYVSRIKISTFGNGKCIYITHPNGYTSVYGHLQRTAEPLESLLKKTHYDEKSFEIERFFKAGEIAIQKGQIIGFTGNTGSSGGPHLHFEFRENTTENVINPLHFGYDKFIKDTKSPVISNLFVYPLGAETVVNQSKRPMALNLKLQKGGGYLADPVFTNGKIGFGINAYDFDDVSFNKNGIYKVQTQVNGTTNFTYQFDSYSFAEMRYINAFIDYKRYKTNQQRVQQLFMKTPYDLSVIKTDSNFGVITTLSNLDTNYTIEATDFFGNTTKIVVPIKHQVDKAIVLAEPVFGKYYVRAKKDSNFELDNISVFLPANTFYDDFNLDFKVKNDTLFLGKDLVPAHTNFSIAITDEKHSELQKEKMFIATINGKKASYNTTYRNGNVFTTKSKTLGTYTLVSDTVAPKITLAKNKNGKNLSNQKTIQLTISDNLSGIKTYNGYLNGKWVLFEYDNKTRKITHHFSDGIVNKGNNNLKVEVVDNMQNTAIFETSFTYN